MNDLRRSAESDSEALSGGWSAQRGQTDPEIPSTARTNASGGNSPELAHPLRSVTAETGEDQLPSVALQIGADHA